MKSPRKVIIAGAAGRDFFDFLSFFKDNPDYTVVAFTANQIPGISNRKFPKSLAGRLYKEDIRIYPEADIGRTIRKLGADVVVFSYSDVSNDYIMGMASAVSAAGADFMLLSPGSTMMKSRKPLISVCAVRTGSGKSPLTRMISQKLTGMGFRVVVIRHPMPYGDLEKQAVQRFAVVSDLDRHKCTIEEREEYEGHIVNGVIVYSGVDYGRILKEAEKEADIIIWDGGNNDFPFYHSDLSITIADARRPGHEKSYYHGSVNVRMADVLVINKTRTSTKENIEEIKKNLKEMNTNAPIVMADMKKKAYDPKLIRGKDVLVVEDGPTLTHGGLKVGAGYLTAKKYGAKRIIDPRPYAVGSIRSTFEKYNHLEKVLPAMGYGKKQMKELEETINAAKCDSVVIGTPIDLARYLDIRKPCVRVTYEFESIGRPGMDGIIERFAGKIRKGSLSS